jgi:hypothetical protein
VHYVDGLCGSAKPHAVVRYAHHRDRSVSLDIYVWLAWRLHRLSKSARMDKKVHLFQPSIFPINHTRGDLASDRVVADIDHTKHTTLDGEMLFITHSALIPLPSFH